MNVEKCTSEVSKSSSEESAGEEQRDSQESPRALESGTAFSSSTYAAKSTAMVVHVMISTRSSTITSVAHAHATDASHQPRRPQR